MSAIYLLYTSGAQPVFGMQAGHPVEFATIVSHQRRAQRQALRRDPVVIRTDRRAFSFQLRADLGVPHAHCGIERREFNVFN